MHVSDHTIKATLAGHQYSKRRFATVLLPWVFLVRVLAIYFLHISDTIVRSATVAMVMKMYNVTVMLLRRVVNGRRA